MSGHGHDPAIAPRTDLIVAAVALVFGVAIIIGSAAMPTFTDQGTPIYVAPGLVPAFHGTIIGLLALILAARSIARGALRAGWDEAREGSRRTALRIALAAILTIAYDLLMVGHMPFWLASAVFVFVFILAFEFVPGRSSRERARNAVIALLIGLGTGIGISLLFERVFLINMP